VKVLLDTHVWIWWLTGSAQLPNVERQALDDLAAGGALGLSAISLWEAQMLHARRRLSLPVSFHEWLRRAADPSVVAVAPMDVRVVLALDDLPANFHGDPADRLIVATAVANGVTLATHDTRIRKSRSVTLWKPRSRGRQPSR
jgi:PIN domain nuclease of toxin-antitoxin system